MGRYNLVENRNSQRHIIDCHKTFSMVFIPATICTVLSITVAQHWHIHQLDMKNAFLHGQLQETVYMHQPLGFRDCTHLDIVYHLQKSLYGLKQAPRECYQWFTEYITRIGFLHSKTDSSLFIFHKGVETVYLLLYVDDIIFIASSLVLLQNTISMLSNKFSMTDLRHFSYFLGISGVWDKSGLFLSQRKYHSNFYSVLI